MKGHFPLSGTLVAALLLVAGCLGGGDTAPRAAETVAPPQTAEPIATEAAPAAEEPREEASATTTPVEEGDHEAPASSATADAGAETPEDTSHEMAATDASGVVPVEDAPGINSYRMHILVSSSTARGEDNIQIEGAFVKAPPAEQILITFVQEDETQEIEVVSVEGSNYTRVGETWIQSPDRTFSNLAEITLLTPQNIAGIVAQMEVIGTETVNGMNATHYRGSKEIIPVVGPAGDTLDVSRVEHAQLDLWADETHNAIVKLILEARNSEPPMTSTLTFDYTDLNHELTIEAPATMPASEEAPAADDFVPRNELGALLGFNLLFPTGSTVETVVGTNLYVVVGPYTLEEAANMIELNMAANGYSLMTKLDEPSGAVNYLFQQGDKVVNITLSDAGDGNTRFQFVTES